MYKIGLENNTEGRSLAWVMGHPGCFAFGDDGMAALQAVPQAIHDYQEWISSRTTDGWLSPADTEYCLEETWECYTINDAFELANEGYEVNAWFRNDWIPLTTEDIQRGLLLLNWGRRELLKLVSGLSPAIMDRTYPGERWSIAGILKHIGSAEWWYLDRLGLAFMGADLSEDPFKRLKEVRMRLVEVLPEQVRSKQVVGVSGEIWSPRKLLRRAVWHEYDHIAHIRKLL